jgi:hypothetical protein
MADQEPQGRAKGGVARREALSPERRLEIARKAAAKRHEPFFTATHGSADHPLRIGDAELPCYVLEDGRRVLSLGGMVGALGMSIGGAGGRQGDRLYQFVTNKSLSPFVSKDLTSRMENAVRFRAPTGGTVATGYEAVILPDICDAVLAARDANALRADQMHIAKQCEILVRGLARVGIIALVDEATGYQRDRATNALAQILEAFIAKELQPWVKTFPNDNYQEMFRLRGLEYSPASVKRPQYFGKLTNDIVYDRLAPGVRHELKKAIPKRENGRPKGTLAQMLTRNVGYPKLREHLGAVVATMRMSGNWHAFKANLDKHYPRYGDLPLFDYALEDDGKGL